MRTNQIRGYISSKLKELGYRVYYKEASNMAKFPYIVYGLKVDFLNGNCSIYDFEVNIWSNNKDISEIEDIADQVEDLMDDEVYLDTNGLLIFDKRARDNIEDPNKDLDRVMIKFEMRYFK